MKDIIICYEYQFGTVIDDFLITPNYQFSSNET